MGVFFSLSLSLYNQSFCFSTSLLWSLHLSRACAHSLLRLFIWCVSVLFLFFFLKRTLDLPWVGNVIPGGWTALGRARARGRPTAAERIFVFKAFEEKLLQFPGYGVRVGRGVPSSGFPGSPGRKGSIR